MNIRKPYYREFRRRLYETLGDKGDSILRYRGADNKEHYIASGNSPDVKPGGGMVETTWQELKDKRDAGKLIPGSLYRITDYQCTTTQENTRSAGHQFDIVLLALSKKKLAEEGWAMMHENIYDVKFRDGRKKCYIAKDTYYSEEDEGEVRNIVDLETGLGVRAYIDYLEIDEENKKANYPFNIVCLCVENLPYNYFQNSNLSAWKVWYCIDNDKSRFAWADDSMNIQLGSLTLNNNGNLDTSAIAINEFPYYADDVDMYEIAFIGGIGRIPRVRYFTKTSNPKIGDTVYSKIGAQESTLNNVGIVQSYIPYQEIPNGRGVIYRMIDECGNDCPYDFKNIQFKRWKVTAADDESFVFSDENPHYFGIYDTENDVLIAPMGVNAELDDVDDWRWCYTFDGYNADKGEQYDFSTHRNKATDEAIQWAIEEYNGGGLQDVCSDNVIECYANADVGGGCTMQKMQLGNNVFFATSHCRYDDDFWDYAFAMTCGNTLGQGAQNNTLGQGAYRNTLGQGAQNNTLGQRAQSNTLWQGAYRNTLGQEAQNNTLGQGAQFNTLGQGAYRNTLGQGAQNNTLGQGAQFNTLGQGAQFNTLGQNCNNIVFDSHVNNVAVSKAYCRYIRVEAGVENVNITTNATTSYSQNLQNIIVGMGVKGTTSSNRKTITHATVNDAKQTTYLPTNSTTINV